MAGRIAAPKKAIVDEDEAKAAAPKPAKITATPILTVNTTQINFKKFILVMPAAKVDNSANAGTGLDNIKPITSKFLDDFSASFKSFSPTMNLAIGLPKNLPTQQPKIAPKLSPIHTTREAIGQPKATPARVLVKPLGTGKKTSAVNAKITNKEIKNQFPLDHSIRVLPYSEKEGSKKIIGSIKEVKITIKKAIHLNQTGKYIYLF